MWLLFDYHASFFAGFSWTFFYGKGFENKSFRSSNHHFLKSSSGGAGAPSNVQTSTHWVVMLLTA